MPYPVSAFTQGRNGPTSSQNPFSNGLNNQQSARGYRQGTANQNPNLPGLGGQQNNNLSALISLLQQLLQLLQGNGSGSSALGNGSNNNSLSNTDPDSNTGTTPAPTPTPAPAPLNTSFTPAPGGSATPGTGVLAARYDNATTPVNTPVTLDVLANDPATNADTRLTDFIQPRNGSLAIVDNKLVYTPNPGFQGHENTSYRTSDGNQANVGIAVGDVSNIPAPAPVGSGSGNGTANGDYAYTITGTPVSIDILANDFNANNDLQIQNVTQPQNGTVTQNGNQLVYTPNPGFQGWDQFSYDTGTGTGTVGVNVESPHPSADFAITDLNTPVTIDVLANDVGAGAEGVTRFTQGQYGSVTQNGSQLTYTPDAGFEGPDTFSYQGAGGNTTVVQVSTGNPGPGVGPVPLPTPAPQPFGTPAPAQNAVQDRGITPLDTPIRIDVLRNDYDPANGRIESFSLPQNGTVTQDGNSFVYTPNAGFQGHDSFSYAREDGGKTSVQVTVGDPFANSGPGTPGTVPGDPGPAPVPMQVLPVPPVNRPFS